MFKRLSIGTKIAIAFVAIAILAVAAVGLISFQIGRATLQQEAFNKLTAVREMKAGQIEGYYQQIVDQVVTLSEDRMIIDAMRAFDESLHTVEAEVGISEADRQAMDAELRRYYQDEYLERLIPNLLEEASVSDYWPEDETSRVMQSLYISGNPFSSGSKHMQDNPGDGSSYSQAHEIYHPVIRDYLERFGYYDIFLVDVDTGGHIAYSVFKEVDYGTSLLYGPYSDTKFAEAYRAARDADDPNFVKLVDFEPYAPSYNAPAGFIASPIFDGEEKIGVLVFQMPIDRINDVMTSNQNWSAVGLGDSGETYIVGDDFLLRNHSRFLIEDSENYFDTIEAIGVPLATRARIRNFDSTIGLQEVKTEGTEAALRGETDTRVFPDYRGVPVLSSFKPLDIPGMNWVIMSEIDEAEAFAAIGTLATRVLLVVAGLVVAIVVAAVVFSRSITRPIQDLTENAQELAGGNLDVEIDTRRGDEIGELAQSFDVMRVSMKDLIENLEERVAERTAQLERATARVRSIVENASDAIITIDSDQNVVLFNPEAERTFGYTEEEVLGKPLTMLMVEKSRAIHPHEVEKFRNEPETSRGMDARRRIHGQRKDGTSFPAEAGISKMVLDGEMFFTAFLRDVTERVEAQAQLNLQATALHAAANGIAITDTDGTIEWVNPAFTGLTGYSSEDAVGQNPRVLKSDKHDEAFYRGMWDTIVSGQVWQGELINKRKDGSRYTEEMTITPVRNPEGEIVHFVAIKQDITERKQMEEEINQQKEMLENTIESLTHPFYVIDVEDYSIQLANSAAKRLADAGTSTCYALTHRTDTPCDSREDPCPLVEVKRTKKPFTVEHIHYDADGNPTYAEVHGYPVFNEAGNVVQMIEYSLDITERKRLEMELERANERMSVELNFAREIQIGMLPLIFPAFPRREEIGLYATLQSAREVGGDFYDFYFLDDDHLCFIIADVSGKGAPGALLMAVSKTLIKSRAADDHEPSSILTHVNDELSRDNESAMFVTAFLGILNVRTGELQYTNAGHNPPYIKRADGTVELVDAFHGPVIGALPGMTYGQDSTVLDTNDMILLYTDGVTEAMDEAEALYSDERLAKLLQAEDLASPETVIDGTLRDVLAHQGEAEQADDITILAMQYTGLPEEISGAQLRLKIKNELAELGVVEERFHEFALQNDIPDAVRQPMSIVLDEMLNNIVSYAYDDEEEHEIDVDIELSGKRLVLTIRDDGVPFNPFGRGAPDTSLSIEDREIGGLGIHLVRSMMDEYLYQRHINKNVVTLVKMIE